MAKRKLNNEAINKARQRKMYTSPSFDTHKVVKSFTVAGLKEEQAEAIVTAIVESRDQDLSKLATKDQFETLRQEVKNQIETVRVQLDSKIDNSISKLEANLLKWFITTAIAMTGIIIAAVKFIY